MITVRPASARGHFDFGWLRTWHSFSFGDCHDPEHMMFRSLRVINEDIVAPGAGFGEHPHRDMEILTYVLSGALTHRDSLGHSQALGPGEVQRMRAGRGIRHSEFNASATEPVHLLQIWIRPGERGLEPGYVQRPVGDMHNKLAVLAAPEGGGGVVDIHQDAVLLAGRLDEGASVRHALAPGRDAWVQVARGRVEVNGVALGPGDGAALTGEAAANLRAIAPAEVLLFDLA